MLDGLSTIVDQFSDSVGLPAMGHLEKLASLFSRQEYCILRLRSLESTVVRVVLNIRRSTWGFLLLTKSICDHCLKILQHLSSSNPPSLVLDNHLEKLISLSATRSIKQADVGSPCWKNLGGLIEMSREVIRVVYAPSIYVYCLPFGYHCLKF